MEILTGISKALIDGNDERAAASVKSAVGRGLPTKQILDDGLIAGMDVVGRRFKAHEIFLPDVLLAARAMCAGLKELTPLLEKEGISSIGSVVIGSVQGDLHDIGKNLVGIMLRGAGFEVVDLGNDVPPDRFIGAAREHGACVIGMSALLTTTMPVMKNVVERVREEGLAGKVLTIVGGAPVTDDFAREIGADAYGFDAANAVERVKGLVGKIHGSPKPRTG